MSNYLNAVKVLFVKEMKDSFYSPLIYILSALFCLIMGWLFYVYLMASKELTHQTLAQSVLVPIFGNMNFIFIFLAPLLTMRSFAEEKKLNTLELLLTSKLTHSQIISAKVLANFMMAVFMVSLTFLFPVILAFSGYENWGQVFSSYIGIFSCILCYISVGVFASTLTDNLVVSALLSFSILLGLMLLALSSNATDNVIVSQMLRYLSLSFHLESFIRAGLKSYNFLYLFSFVGFFFYLSHLSLESRKW